METTPKQTIFIPMDSMPARNGNVDLTGFVGGRLTITGFLGKKVYPKGAQVNVWKAKCTCGNEVPVNGQHFINGNIKSCGCLRQEKAAECKRRLRTRKRLHGIRPEPINLTIEDLKARKGAWKDHTGTTMGNLKVVKLLRAVLYWAHNSRPKNRKSSVEKHVVTHWACTCSCGNYVERSSSYLYGKKYIPSCQTCSRTVGKLSYVAPASPEVGPP